MLTVFLPKQVTRSFTGSWHTWLVVLADLYYVACYWSLALIFPPAQELKERNLLLRRLSEGCERSPLLPRDRLLWPRRPLDRRRAWSDQFSRRGGRLPDWLPQCVWQHLLMQGRLLSKHPLLMFLVLYAAPVVMLLLVTEGPDMLVSYVGQR